MRVSALCSACHKGALISDQECGEIICSNCGLVLSDKAIEMRAEWRTFDAESKARAGTPLSLARHDMGLSTVIGRVNKDAGGNVLNPATLSAINRWRTWDSRIQIHSSSDRNLQQAFDELDRLKSKLNLSDAIVEKTAYTYRKARERQLVRGRTTASLLSACTYISCRELDTPVTLSDIAAFSDVKRKSVSRNYRLLVRELDIKVPMIDPMKCVVKIANKAGLSERTKRQAMHIMDTLAKTEIRAGKNPMGFAATILYASCLIEGEVVTQKVIADAAGVTDMTIRNRFKHFKSLPLMAGIITHA